MYSVFQHNTNKKESVNLYVKENFVIMELRPFKPQLQTWGRATI
jgi:hypothetical protein